MLTDTRLCAIVRRKINRDRPSSRLSNPSYMKKTYPPWWTIRQDILLLINKISKLPELHLESTNGTQM